MRIGIFSDLHIRHWNSHRIPTQQILDYILNEVKDCDVIINAGDTETNLSGIFNMVYPDKIYIEVKGNHDYYDGPAADVLLDEAMGSVVVNGVKIAWAPLWTHLKTPMDELKLLTFSDYRWIKDFNAAIWNDAYFKHFEFLRSSEADIIVSHHAPFSLSIHDDYKGDSHNVMFVNSLDYEMYQFKKKPKLWAHGHVHNFFDYEFDDIRVICNPFGYYFEPNHKNYKVKVIEI